MNRLTFILGFLLVTAVPIVGASEPTAIPEQLPCEKETDPLMSVTTNWTEIYAAASALPKGCFDGYFAEGISDTIVRKMGMDWKGFLGVLAKHPANDKFFSLVLRSINATLDPDDIRLVGRLTRTQCTDGLKVKCDAISKQVDAALADYNPPEKRDGP